MPDTSSLNRIERRKLEFRNRITQAALTLFEHQGVADTSVAAIIKEADIAHKTFFNHFPTKEHLLKHIACTFSDNAYQAFSEGFKKQTDPRKRIRYCLMSIAKTLEHVSDHYKELLNLYLISGAAQSELQQQQREQFRRLIDHIIGDADNQKLLRRDFSPEILAEVVIGLCVSTLLAWSQQDNYPIVTKMEAQAAFINASLFV